MNNVLIRAHIVSQVGWLQWSTQTPYRPSSWLLDHSSLWALVIWYFHFILILLCFFLICCNVKTNPVCDTELFASKNDSNLHTRPQLSIRWEAMKNSMTCTSRPSLLSRLTSVRAATSLGQTPSIFLGTRLPGTCRGLALCLDSPFRPPGTGAPIRSVKQMGRTVWRDHDFTCADSVAAMRKDEQQFIFSHIRTHIYGPLSRLFLPDSLKRSEVADKLPVRP